MKITFMDHKTDETGKEENMQKSFNEEMIRERVITDAAMTLTMANGNTFIFPMCNIKEVKIDVSNEDESQE